MSHARKQIRDAVVAALDDITLVSGRAFANRVYPHDTLPDITVFTPSDEVERDYDIKGPKEWHVLSIEVEIRAKVTANLDAALDALCEQAEIKLMADPTLGGLVKPLELERTTIALDGESDKPVGLATQTWQAHYRINRNDPGTIIT